jgi:hypothetical protein
MKTTKDSNNPNQLWKILASIGIIAIISMISISAANLDNNESNDVFEGTLYGTVFHAITGQPLPGTQIKLSYHDLTRTTETDSSGNFRITDIPLCFCLKNLSANRDGFEVWFQMLAVDETTFENIFLEPKNDSNSHGVIDLRTDKNTYTLGEKISIFMTNIGETTLEHPNGYGDATIMDMEGNIVFNGWAVDTGNSSLWPNQKVTVGTWDQRDNDNAQVPFGTYTIKKEYGGVDTTTSFIIAMDDDASAIMVSTDQDAYGIGDCVVINVTNIGNETLFNPNGWGGFTIEDKKSEVVYDVQINIEMLTSLKPGETKKIGSWEQLDNSGYQVQPGTYTIIKEYGGSTDTVDIEIRDYFIPIKGDIIGKIIDAAINEPLPDVAVTLEYHGFSYNTQSDSEGSYNFIDVSICFCLKNISVNKQGYEGQSSLVSVSEITFVNFSLKPIDGNNKSGAIKITTDKDAYELGEPITIYMTNVGNTTLKHPTGWQDYKIRDVFGNIVFIQNIVTEANTELLPGKMVTVGTWDQVPDYDHQEIQPGTYIVEKEYGGCKNTSTFIIIESNVSDEDDLDDKEKDLVKNDVYSTFGGFDYNFADFNGNLIFPMGLGLITIILTITVLIFMVNKKKKLKQMHNKNKNIHKGLRSNTRTTQMFDNKSPQLSIIDWHQPVIEDSQLIQY